MKNLTIVVLMIGATVMIDVIGIVVLAVSQNPIPDTLTTIAVAGMTGLVGLLVRPGPDSPPAP
jgi:hypothetical protein